MARILGVSGSLREGSNTLLLVQKTLEYAREAGAETRLLDLREYPLPLYEAHEGYDDNPHVKQITELVDECDALILGSPEYHGCMSGAMKNYFDYLYREIAGKLFGLVAATGGSQGVGCFHNMRSAIQFCHGWALPYHTAVSRKSFDADGNLVDERALDRLKRTARDLVVYAPLLHNRFKDDLAQPEGEPHGFAHWMA